MDNMWVEESYFSAWIRIAENMNNLENDFGDFFMWDLKSFVTTFPNFLSAT